MIRKLVYYLFQGLLLLAPVVITFMIFFSLFVRLDDFANDLLEQIIHFRLRGLGFILLLGLVILVGFLSSTLVFRPLFIMMEEAIARAPLANIIYTSLKDFISAFVSDKRKFNQPVIVNINGRSDFQKLGFITRQDLSFMGLKDKVAVYFPHSYNFSGNLFIVDSKNITPLDVPVAEFMKFIVSGGITEWEIKPEAEQNKDL
ncbi:MAG: hypothetical protein KatS3mg031_2262 [Chitinophagales bacterium]|nr:MAG: hypothetical protein KatS3mg031_2262 [Chitinophagales bacterium]